VDIACSLEVNRETCTVRILLQSTNLLLDIKVLFTVNKIVRVFSVKLFFSVFLYKNKIRGK